MLPYDGTIRLLVCKPPWKISVDLKAVGITLASIRTEWHDNQKSDWISTGISELITSRCRYYLQLEHKWTHLRFPVVEASLMQSLQTSFGWRFDFRLHGRSEDLILMLDELGHMGDGDLGSGKYAQMLDRAFGAGGSEL